MPLDPEFDDELRSLWQRLSESSLPGGEPRPASLSEGPAASPTEPHQDAVSFLKARHHRELEHWRDLLDEKEKAETQLQARLKAAQEESTRSRERAAAEIDELLTELSEATRALEELRTEYDAALEKSNGESEKEKAAIVKGHRDYLGKVEAQLKASEERAQAEIARLQKRLEEESDAARQMEAYWTAQERRWHEKEQKLSSRVKELEALTARLEKAASAAEPERARLAQSAAETRQALERAIESLQRESSERARFQSEASKSGQAAAALQTQLAELKAQTEAERGQWRDLWDRDRSTWESQRAEFAAWEQRLRQEREAWLEVLRSKEAEEIEHASRLTQVLKDSSEWLARLSGAGQADRRLPVVEWAGLVGARSAVLLVFLAAAAGLGWLTWEALTTIPLRRLDEHSVGLAAATGIAASSDRLWACEWSGRLLAYEAKDFPQTARAIDLKALQPVHPMAVSAGASGLWVLDAAQSRLLRLDPQEPDRVIAGYRWPGLALVGLADDGRSLWSFDAASRRLLRLEPGTGAAAESLSVAGVLPAGLAWFDGGLWAYDARASRVVRLVRKGEGFSVGSSREMAGVSALSGSGRTLWTLESEGTGFKVRRWAVGWGWK